MTRLKRVSLALGTAVLLTLLACYAIGQSATKAALQDAVNKAHAAGGGTVWVPRGTTVLPRPLLLYSNVRLLGQGRLQSRLKLADGVQAMAVVQTAGFDPAANVWNYRAGKVLGKQTTYTEADNLHMGVVVENLTIDGNRRGKAKAHGLCLYGGSFRVDHVGITDCDGHGLWTQCGRADNSWEGDAEYCYQNMHESLIQDVTINCVTGHGVWYCGPNDSYMDKVQVKMAGGCGFLLDYGDNFSAGGLKAGMLHAYSCRGPAQFWVKMSAFSADYLFSDTPVQTGVRLDGSGNVIDKMLVMFHNRGRKNDSWGLELNGRNNHVGYYRYLNTEAPTLPATPLHGGALRTQADGCTVPAGLLWGGGAAVTCKGQATAGEAIFGGAVQGWDQ